MLKASLPCVYSTYTSVCIIYIIYIYIYIYICIRMYTLRERVLETCIFIGFNRISQIFNEFIWMWSPAPRGGGPRGKGLLFQHILKTYPKFPSPHTPRLGLEGVRGRLFGDLLQKMLTKYIMLFKICWQITQVVIFVVSVPLFPKQLQSHPTLYFVLKNVFNLVFSKTHIF